MMVVVRKGMEGKGDGGYKPMHGAFIHDPCLRSQDGRRQKKKKVFRVAGYA
jgi:hypothetical protein